MHDRFLLIVDDGLFETGMMRKDEIIQEGLLEAVENEELFQSLKGLTDKQLQILEMIYVKDYSIKAIAETLQTTPQNISNLHRKALQKLQQKLRKEEG